MAETDTQNPSKAGETDETTPGYMARLRRRFLVLLIVIGVGAALFVQFYYIPRTAGDDFARAFLSLDTQALEGQICGDEDAREARQRIAQAGNDVIGLIADTLPVPLPEAVRREAAALLEPQASYNPFTSTYRFSLVSKRDIDVAGFRVDAGFESPQVALSISRSLFAACIDLG